METSILTSSDLGTPGTNPTVTVRLFAAARQAAGGVSQVTVQATTVGDVLAQGAATYGPAWARVAAASRTWVNGEPATAERELVDGDEVAVLPPVSGGAA